MAVRSGGDSVEIRVLSFEADYFDHPADESGREELAGRVPPEALARAVAAGAKEVLDEHGEAAYRERWIEHPFRTATLK